jgi:fructokinase
MKVITNALRSPLTKKFNVFGGIEAGGTKFICGVGTAPDDLKRVSIPTSEPDETIRQAIRFIQEEAGQSLSAVGIGSFGPIDLDPSSRTYGYITSTPKLAWRNYDLAGSVARALRVPVAFDTDVNAAALAEARWGAARGIDNFIYLTVGTGIGGGAIVNGSLVHGLVHPEMGHIRVPHDVSSDPFAGRCPYHGDCLEGLASGTAIKQRWGKPAHDLHDDHPAWKLEAHYLALALANWVLTLSPQRIVIGGGVMQRTLLFPQIREKLRGFLNDYLPNRVLNEDIDTFVVPAALTNDSGILGAILLAQEINSKED